MSGADAPDRARWAAVTSLFSRAIEQPAEARAAFVRAEAGADETLARDVLSLLAAHDRAGTFLESPPAAADASRDLLAPGQIVGHYRIAGLLGEGGMGVVYLAEDTRLGRTIALKAIASSDEDAETRVARLRREARAAAALNDPGIATVYALEEIDGRLFIGSEYVPGETLRDEIARGPASLARTIETGRALASALASAHAGGVVHRDLKPENIVRTPDGRVKILDFGLARFVGAHDDGANLTGNGVIGTPAYMAPEQIRGADLDGRADLFSLGVILYELATGVHPFAAPTPAATLARILEDEPAPLRAVLPASSLADPALDVLDHVIARCLRKDPTARIASAQAMVGDDLRRAEPSAFAQGYGGPPKPWRRWSGSAAAGGPEGPPLRKDPQAMKRVEKWWQFHQAAATIAYVVLLVPLWRARHLTPGPIGMTIFLAALVSVVVAGALRLHVWFAARELPDVWLAQHARARPWTRAADVLFTLCLLAAGLRVVGRDDGASGLLVAAAAGVAISFSIIEPATTRAAMREQPPIVNTTVD
jgi:serine/threonine protein kinase